MILASYSLTAALVAASYGRIVRLVGPRGTITLAALGLGAGALLLALMHGGPLALAAGCIVTGAGAGLVEPSTVSLVLQRAPAALQTRAIGLLLGAVFLGQFLNPLAVNPLRAALGIHGAFIAVGVVFLLLAVLALLVNFGRLAGPGASAAIGARSQSAPR
jgi:MFS family permease